MKPSELASALGKLGRGKSKTFSARELERRRKRLAKGRASRWTPERRAKQAEIMRERWAGKLFYAQREKEKL